MKQCGKNYRGYEIEKLINYKLTKLIIQRWNREINNIHAIQVLKENKKKKDNGLFFCIIYVYYIIMIKFFDKFDYKIFPRVQDERKV